MTTRVVIYLITLYFVKCQAQWTWISGSDSFNDPPLVESPSKTFNPSNTPGGRSNGGVWYDGSDLVWVYSGLVENDTSTDLWFYNLTNNEWAFISKGNVSGCYDFTHWPVSSNEVYFYGGVCSEGLSSDMYRLNIASSLDPTWTLLSSNKSNIGTIGTEDPSYSPGPRSGSGGWIGNGTLWLFGGQLSISSNFTNDLWRYNLSSSNWAFMGSSTDMGLYNKSSANAWPRARQRPSTWTHNGLFWLFGGSSSGELVFNDLWYFKETKWNWISGNDPEISPFGKYGTKGIGTEETVPGGRALAAVWTDSRDIIWIFGGLGLTDSYGDLQDVWIFNTSSLIWTFVDGTNTTNAITNYNSIGKPIDIPSSRSASFFVYLNDSYVWMYGGVTENGNLYSDVLEFDSRNISHIEIIKNENKSSLIVTNKGISSSALAVVIVLPILAVCAIAILLGVFAFKKSNSDSDSFNSEDDHVAMETVIVPSSEKMEGITIGALIGSGNFGDVYGGFWQKTPVALKKMKKEYFSIFQKEFTTLMALKHPQIVQYYGIHVDVDNYIVMELMESGELGSLLRTREFSEEELLKLSLQCASGVAYLHNNNIIHRDIALRNFLASELSNGTVVVKLSDFGMATLMSDSYYQSETKSLPYKWASVEVLKFGKYSTASDVWAFAVALWELFSLGAQPYPGKTTSEASDFVLSGNRLEKPAKCPQEVFNLMLQCWSDNTKQRPTMTTIHTFLGKLLPQPATSSTLPSDLTGYYESSKTEELYNN